MRLTSSSGRVVAFVAALLFLLAMAAMISIAVALSTQRSVIAHVQLVNRGAVDLAAQSLRAELDKVRGDALVLAQPLAASRVLVRPDPDERERVERLFTALAGARGDYAQIRLIDTRGIEVVRVDHNADGIHVLAPAQLQDKHTRGYVRAIARLNAGQTLVTRMDLNVEHGRIVEPIEPTLRVGAPVFGLDGQRLGIVVINVDGRQLLTALAQGGRLADGQMWLADRDGNWLRGPDPARDWRFMHPELPVAGVATDFPAAWSMLRERGKGQVHGAAGLLTFDRIRLGSPADSDTAAPALRVVAYAPPVTLAMLLTDRAHLLYYALLLPLLVLVAATFTLLRVRLVRARGQIAANSRLLQDIFQHTSVAMRVKDRNGRLVRVNAAAARLLGRDPAELIGHPIDAFVVPSMAQSVLAHDREVIESGRVSTIEERVELLGGTHTLLTTRFPVSDERGRIAGVGAISLDITERIRTEQLLRLAKDRAEAANQAKATFLASMSHELRTPLNSIIGLGELLLEQAQDDQANELSVESLRRVVGAGRHLLALINDILDIARVEAGHVDLHAEPIMLGPMIDNVLAGLRPLAAANGDVLAREWGEDPGIVHVDVTRLRQVLLNLVGNAIKFTRDGRVTLRAMREGDRLHIAVADTGIGMTPEQMERIFEPFEQADHSNSRRFGGTGLGLAISRQLADLMGGQIEVSSRPGEGSVFTLVLPMGKPAAAAAVAPGSTALVAQPPRQPVVLVADDDADARDLIRATLERAGMRVVTATSGAEALAAVRRDRPAVLVLDIILGDMSGWDVLTVLRADPDHAGLPVILCTVTDPDHRTASLGVIDHLTKPVDRDRLTGLVRRFLDSDGPGAVLLVDDDDDYREQLAVSLRQAGHYVSMAASGEQALHQMRREPPDLVLLDLVMPGMDGLAVIAAMRQEQMLVPIPVVLVTAADVPPEVVERLYRSAVLLVRKGDFDHDGIARRVAGLMARVARTDAGGEVST